MDALTRAMRSELERYPALAKMRLGTFSVTALDVSAHDTAAHVRVTVSFHADGLEPWITAGVSSDLNQAALMAIVGWVPLLASDKSGVARVSESASQRVSKSAKTAPERCFGAVLWAKNEFFG